MPINRSIRPPVYRQEADYDALPVASEEDVEFSEELADEDDMEARERAAEADRRAMSYDGD